MAYGYPNYPAYGTAYGQPQPYQNQIMPQTAQQMPPPAVQATQPMQGISASSRPVTNREEAVSTPADFTGAPMLFPDFPHGRVYVKRWNVQTGSADFVEFAPVPPQSNENQGESTAFVSLQDFQDLQELVDSLKKEIDRLKKPVGKAVKKNDADE